MATTIRPPIAKAQMLIRRPPAKVFEAFVDPAVTTHFWFTRSSGRLVTGKKIRWDWEMYGVSTTVEVKAIEENQRILIEWNGPDDPSLVEWQFESTGDGHTLVRIRNWRFEGDSDKVVGEALDSTGGFSFVLAGAKAFLEHGIELNLIRDHDPAALKAPIG
jgi:uncharacterized protein YndB with AHSA1/START domain